VFDANLSEAQLAEKHPVVYEQFVQRSQQRSKPLVLSMGWDVVQTKTLSQNSDAVH